MNANATIPDQVKLPLRIALEVVLQGLRIRLGRSIVTITGVICGIAFLMSILTRQIVKRGVAVEDARREEVSRIVGRHLFQHIGCLLWGHTLEDRHLQVRLDLFESVSNCLGIERLDERLPHRPVECADNVGDVGGMHLTDAITRHS